MRMRSLLFSDFKSDTDIEAPHSSFGRGGESEMEVESWNDGVHKGHRHDTINRFGMHSVEPIAICISPVFRIWGRNLSNS